MSQKSSKLPKKAQNDPEIYQIWKYVIEQSLEMKSYQFAFNDFKTNSLWPDCIIDISTGQNNKIYSFMMLRMKKVMKKIEGKRGTS